MKEKRVYLIDLHTLKGGEQHAYLTNEEFIEKAEEQGSVYSLSGFQTSYNTNGLDSIFKRSAIRFI